MHLLPKSLFGRLVLVLFGGLLVNIGLHQWRYMVVAVVLGLILYFAGIPSA